MGKLIGIFGGSFDPIHLGHLNLAVEMLELHRLDEVWFCPAACSPHKHHYPQVNVQHRLNMLRLAIQEEPRFSIIETEINREAPSYTIDTLNELSAQQQDKVDPDRFVFILGEDTARNFHKWRQPESILNLAQLLVGERPDREKPLSFQGSPRVVEAIKKGLTPIRLMEISSKEIRKRLLNHEYCYHLLPGKVVDYIASHCLYSPASSEARFL